MTLLVVLLAAAASTIQAVRFGTIEGRPALTLVSAGDLIDLSVGREGEDVVIRLRGRIAPGLVVPQVGAPLHSLRLEAAEGSVHLKVRVDPDLTYEVRRDGGTVQVLFGLAVAPQAGLTSDMTELHKKLFPALAAAEEGGGQAVKPGKSGSGAEQREGFGFGPVHLKPSVVFSYIDANSAFLDTPQPVRDRYLQIEPSLGLQYSVPHVDLGTGGLKVSYTPRFRKFSSFQDILKPTHEINASLSLEPTPSLAIYASDHFEKGVLEATEVDPGREYFFHLGPFRRHQVEVGTRITVGPRIGVDASGRINRVHTSGDAAFFDYETQQLRAGLGYELTPALRLSVQYVVDRVPTPADRPQAGFNAHSVDATVSGNVGSLETELRGGYRAQENAQAGAGGRRFRGGVFSGRVTKELTRGLRLTLLGSRGTLLSAFESNGFYVSTSGQAQLSVPLPLAFALQGGVGYLGNEYRTVALEIGAPRRDHIFSWNAGLAHGITRRAFARVDYRRERRDSNIESLDNTTHAFIAQLGIGLFGAPAGQGRR